MYYVITPDDVGKFHIRAWGRVWPVSDFLGRILPQDRGKRVYKVGDILQVENEDQRTARIAKGAR